jgi:hypothetical protein
MRVKEFLSKLHVLITGSTHTQWWNMGTPRRRRTHRSSERFKIGPNSHPRKVQRYLAALEREHAEAFKAVKS